MPPRAAGAAGAGGAQHVLPSVPVHPRHPPLTPGPGRNGSGPGRGRDGESGCRARAARSGTGRLGRPACGSARDERAAPGRASRWSLAPSSSCLRHYIRVVRQMDEPSESDLSPAAAAGPGPAGPASSLRAPEFPHLCSEEPKSAGAGRRRVTVRPCRRHPGRPPPAVSWHPGPVTAAAGHGPPQRERASLSLRILRRFRADNGRAGSGRHK